MIFTAYKLVTLGMTFLNDRQIHLFNRGPSCILAVTCTGAAKWFSFLALRSFLYHCFTFLWLVLLIYLPKHDTWNIESYVCLGDKNNSQTTNQRNEKNSYTKIHKYKLCIMQLKHGRKRNGFCVMITVGTWHTSEKQF